MRTQLVVGLALALGCTGIKVVPPPDRPEPTPDGTPAPPVEPVEPGSESMNTEYCRVSCAEEQARFVEFGKAIQRLQTLQTTNRSQPVQRGFHAKAHGCLMATVEPLPDRDPRAKFGVWAEGKGPYPAWVRFSNAVGWRQPDDELDARGMAVKLMGIEGPRLNEDEKQTQDFLMTNSATPVGRDAEEFMEFAFANEKGTLGGIGFLLGHPRTAGPALTSTGAPSSMINEQYFSGAAFHLGAHQATKFSARRCDGSKPREKLKGDDPDYLKKDLAAAASEGLCFTLLVQFQVDPGKTPIEHASFRWEEDVSPFVPVATIKMPPQSLDKPGLAEFCDSLSFSPWHGIQAHQPMGHINRARRAVYDASRAHRDGGFEPSDFGGFDQSATQAQAR